MRDALQALFILASGSTESGKKCEIIYKLKGKRMSLDREIRIVNRNFSLGEYGESWTKIERYLFIEIYNAIKDFYIANTDSNIVNYSSDSITVKLPIAKIDRQLLKINHRNQQLCESAEGLSKKQINIKKMADDGTLGFYFVSMFTFIRYDPSADKEHMYVKIPSEIYEEMVPIASFCQLDLKLLSKFNSGNTIRLYEIFKSYAFKKNFEITFNDLRKKLGFFKEGVYVEWKYFHAKVLKPAVIDINNHKEFDIEVFYKKIRGSEVINFTIETHGKQSKKPISILSLDALIDSETRQPNMIQNKYIDTLINHCKSITPISNPKELKEWIISDLIMQQNKLEQEFDFRHAMNAISKQIRKGLYTRPFSHQYLSVQVNS